MAEASDTAGMLRQNLVDAGCAPETVRRCMALAQSGQGGELLCLLSGHRRQLLDTLHENERRIDCLDYLIYKIKKNNV